MQSGAVQLSYVGKLVLVVWRFLIQRIGPLGRLLLQLFELRLQLSDPPPHPIGIHRLRRDHLVQLLIQALDVDKLDLQFRDPLLAAGREPRWCLYCRS